MQEKDFVAYEYRTVSVKARDRVKASDVYEAFGWEIVRVESTPSGGATLSLRRDRKQKHKTELGKLERQAEEKLAALDGLRRSTTLGANVFAYTFGSAAALLFGGGMSLAMLVSGGAALVGGSALGIVGLALCGVNYAIYSRLVAKKTKQVRPVIDQTEDDLAVVLEKGNSLLSADII